MQKRGRFETPHGTIETPVFMNVGTLAANKGCGFYYGLKRNRISGRII